jgi:uncharacterized protein (DUF934 family)
MTTLIKNRRIVEDRWQTVGLTPGDAEAVPPAGDIIVPLALWLERRAALSAHPGRVGVWLGPADEPARVAEGGAFPELIAIHFPVFTDGRGYSSARVLRQRYGFSGELRAIGEVLRDTLFELARCGFDAFSLRADQNAEAALIAFDDFSEVYQAAVDRTALYARRPAGQGHR